MAPHRPALLSLLILSVVCPATTLPGPMSTSDSGPCVTDPDPVVALATILQAYVSRDAATVLACHLSPTPTNPDRKAFIEWAVRSRMTERRHIIRVVSVSLRRVSTERSGHVAELSARLVATPAFSAARPAPDGALEFTWQLVRPEATRCWYFYGGGF